MSTPAVSAAWAREALERVRGRLAGSATERAWLRARAFARRRPGVALALLAGAGLVPPWVASSLGRHGPPGVATAEVRSGPFRVTVVETGTLQALRSVSYASTIQSNQAKIVALAPEGRLVQKGDLLILFDAAPFEEEIRKTEAQLAQAAADLSKARQDYALQTIQNREEVAASRQKVARSEMELKDAEDGKGRLREEEAAAAVATAERELAKVETALGDLRPLLESGFITRQELERGEQAVEKAREDKALAERRREALVRYGRPLELAQARSEATLTREGLRQLEAAGAYRLEQKRAAIAAAESRLREAEARLALARQQLARTEVRADVPGIVVYRTVFFGSEQRKPQVGDQVWANQPLLILPDVSKMVVETKVRETDVHKVEKNQQVAVRVDAYPDLRLTGAVTLVGTLAQEEKERRGAKYFSVTVEVHGQEPRLRPGMTARVEIEVEARPEVLSVPLEAVFAREGGHVAFVARGGRAHEVPLVLGPSNEDHVVVEKGLARGDRVCLRDPNAPSSEAGSAVPGP